MLGPEEITKRFGSTATPPEGMQVSHAGLAVMYFKLANYLDENLEDGREKSLAFTALEEASMWSHKALARQADPATWHNNFPPTISDWSAIPGPTEAQKEKLGQVPFNPKGNVDG